jgi:membrane protease YdiL (CAAX protease family)
MNDYPERQYEDSADEPVPVLPVPRKKGWPWLAWPLIIAMTVLAVLGGRIRHQEREQQEDGDLEDAVVRMQARYAVGAAQATGQGETMLAPLAGLNAGPVSQRLRFAILAGELAGPQKAEQTLGQIEKAVADNEIKPSVEQAALLDILQRLYGDYAASHFNAPSVSAGERKKLTDRLGWFGELALAPQVPTSGKEADAPASVPNATPRAGVLEEASRTFWTTIAAVFSGFGLVGLGVVCLVVFVILAAVGKVRDGLPNAVLHGGVYAETFAVWMVLFAGLTLAVALARFPPETGLLWQGGAMLLSLAALVWPVVRGIPWTQVRQDLGLTLGRQPLLEPVYGVGCYLMALPVLAIGVLIVVIYLLVESSLAGAEGGGGGIGPIGRAAHPIVRYLAHGDWGVKLQILVVASVVAPLVEETMFRGVLFRHLREASRRWGTCLSFLGSATVVSFLFAVVHPQGLLAVPLLMSLAFGFALAREWRGSLVASMVGHGLNNGLVLLVAILALGD